MNKNCETCQRIRDLERQIATLKIYAPAQKGVASPARQKAIREADLAYWGVDGTSK